VKLRSFLISVSFSLPSYLTSGKEPPIFIEWALESVLTLGEEKPLLALPEIDMLFLGCLAHNLVAIPITLSRICRHHPRH
jgi:hypothetical protein